MGVRKIKFTIDSDLDQVSLVGTAVNRLCLTSSFSIPEAYNIELCVVEAVTNSIKHSYLGEKGREVTVVFTLTEDFLAIDVCDYGISMDVDVLTCANLQHPEWKTYDVETIADCGRGIGIMKTIMDSVTYVSEKGENCLTLIKNISPLQ